MKKFWNWSNRAAPERTLFLGGTIAEESWFDDDVTPQLFKEELNAGDEIQVVNPTGQATDAASYIKLQQRLIGAGQGLSYEATSRDMSQSNSTICSWTTPMT